MIWAAQVLALSLAFVLTFAGYVQHSQMVQSHPPPGRPPITTPASARSSDLFTGNIWVYTMVATDYGGDQLLRHFIEHYHALGVPYDRFLFVLHHNPAYRDDPTSSYQRSMAFLRANNFAFRNWVDQYSSLRAAIKFLEATAEVVMSPDSWVLKLDVDELLDTRGLSIRELVSMAEAEGATYVRGQLVDRLAPGGQLRRILPNKPLWEQFPVACRVPESIAGPHDRIVAFKAFLRPDDEGHQVVPPQFAAQYWAPCKEEPAMAAGSGIYKDCFGSEGVEPAKLEGYFHLTPYAKWASRYAGAVNSTAPPDQAWRATPFSRQFAVHHVKWHAGIVANLRDRAAWYRGSCQPQGPQVHKCTPRHAAWKQMVAAFYAVSGLDPAVEPTITCEPNTQHPPRASPAAEVKSAAAAA